MNANFVELECIDYGADYLVECTTVSRRCI